LGWAVRFAAVASVVFCVTACAGTTRRRNVEGADVPTGPGTLTEARTYLEGRWTLLSFELFSGGSPIVLKGEGTLSYDEFSNLDMEIRVDETSGRTLDELGIPSQNGRVSIAGRTVIDLAQRTLTYVVEGQAPLAPQEGPLSSRRPRYWEVQGSMLTLRTRGDDGAVLSVARWRKMP
jgi:hypothetical protein